MTGNLRLWGKVTMWLMIFQALFLLWAFYNHADVLVYELFLINLVAGPACLIAYLVEVSRGVFRED